MSRIRQRDQVLLIVMMTNPRKRDMSRQHVLSSATRTLAAAGGAISAAVFMSRVIIPRTRSTFESNFRLREEQQPIAVFRPYGNL